MIKLPGVLTVRLINGRRGEFRIGRLVTDLGEFTVKDAELDQYDEGKYEGEFGINQILPSYYPAGGRLVVEVRAILGFISLNQESALESVTDTLLEQDPIEEGTVQTKPEAVASEVDASEQDTAPVVAPELGAVEPENNDADLFGLLWPLTDTVKLDPTVDRGLFRLQRDRLKALGYQFKPLEQQWLKS